MKHVLNSNHDVLSDSQRADMMSKLKMFQITMGTGIAGAVIENGRPWSRLCEPGKVVLNLVPDGDFDFPRGLAANNQIAKAALERAFRVMFKVDANRQVNLRHVAAIGSGQPVPSAALPGVSLPKNAADLATEVFRLLGRGIADLIMTVHRHVGFDAFGLAGGPLRGMPEVVVSEVEERCQRYGYSISRIDPDALVFSIGLTDPLLPTGPLGQELEKILDGAGEYTADVLDLLIAHVENTMPLSGNSDVKEAEGRYMPVAAYHVMMDAVASYYAAADRFTVDFDGKPFAVIAVPNQWKPSVAINEFIAKFPAALVTNQAMTAEFDTCNYLGASTIAATIAPLKLSEGHRYVLEGTPYGSGLGVISGCYYSTWKDVSRHVVKASSSLAEPSPDTGNAVEQLAIGIDIGGTGIKMTLLIRHAPSDDWKICTHLTGVTLPSPVNPDDVSGNPLITTPEEPTDECLTESAIKAPDADIDNSAAMIVKRVQAFAKQAAPNAQVVKVGVVFPAAVAENAVVAAPSRIAGAFEGQTTSIINAHAAQLLELDVIQSFKTAWENSDHPDTPKFTLANDGQASAFGAYNAVRGLPKGIRGVAEPEGAYGSIGVTLL